ncbi:flavodoxin family protein [Methanogenium marinum]|uniref:Flavodoxin family protein n=1 Tax=Methanogenium marinum TaxID=348610 RepID=A0A9Q4KSY9_9EURY|nr:flavodoxin family protein [Methanogenium marinum]MDE4907402.1 flavodoxin family protein [Methanogenium marinum]
MKVIGVSGSPIPNSNTDRAIKAVLDATGMETEFVKLSNHKFEGCRGCLKCVSTNVCVLNDDITELAQRVKDADALVVGGYTPYSSLDGRTKSFLERLYCLHHQKGLQRGKPAGIVITSAVPQHEPYPPVAEMGVMSVKNFMQEAGMNVVGDVKIVGSVPCMKCGNGDTCEFSGVKVMFGPDATVETVGFHGFETQPEAVKAAEELGKRIAQELSGKSNFESKSYSFT